MPGGLYVNYLKELQLHYKYLENDNFSMAWRQLERAHILAQP